jgi:hypothetical protein
MCKAYFYFLRFCLIFNDIAAIGVYFVENRARTRSIEFALYRFYFIYLFILQVIKRLIISK